jgi:hypothetical protein
LPFKAQFPIFPRKDGDYHEKLSQLRHQWAFAFYRCYTKPASAINILAGPKQKE